MHQRFSLNATSGSKLSDVDQFTFNNQQICWQHIFSEQTVCADAQLNATVCHFADAEGLLYRQNSKLLGLIVHLHINQFAPKKYVTNEGWFLNVN